MNDTKAPEPELNIKDFLVPDDGPATGSCSGCGRPMILTPQQPPYILTAEFCRPCQNKYPSSLLKAVVDNPFDYVLKLRTGETWYFSGASLHGDFVSLSFDTCNRTDDEYPRPFRFERGVEVRASDIVWCADAPDGS